jgi:dipeptidase D
MNNDILNLEPGIVWKYFNEILQIPRPSKKEGKIVNYLLNFGKEHKLETVQDEVGNVLIRKNASQGMENRPWVVMQSHIDMVCEKNSDKSHDFENDPIEAFVDGDWVKANGTTLGADDGIGVAAQLAILASDDIQHGPIECLFTIDEETGLTGAFGLKPGFLKSNILLNLDSEDDGQIFIGCAGGKDSQAWLPFDKVDIPDGFSTLKIMVAGLKGGHSGDDINKNRGNANKILNRFLWENFDEFDIQINNFDGGNLRNAIAREASAIIMIPEEKIESLKHKLIEFEKDIKGEFHISEPNLTISILETEEAAFVIDKESAKEFLNAVYACPHGVIAMSQDIDNFVETSTNLASIKFLEEDILITTSQRSSIESAKDDICNMVESVFRLAGGRVEQSDGYPGWKPNPESKIVAQTAEAYERLFGNKPEVLAIHAGLECGLIGHKYPKMDMTSFGPTIRGAHSPDERIEIESVRKFWLLTLDILKGITN